MQARKSFPPPCISTSPVKALSACVLALLLAACGHANTPAEGKPANATAATSTADASSMPATSAPVPSHHDESDEANDGDGHKGLSKPPPGTLHYTIALTGELHTTGRHKGESRNAVIKRKLEVTSHMQAELTNGRLADANPARPKAEHSMEAANAPMEDLAREMAKCNGDMACITAKNAKRMASPGADQAIQDAGNQVAGAIGRTAVWSRRAPCAGHLAIDDDDDRATWWEDVGEGYHKTGLDKRHSVIHTDGKVDCAATNVIEAMAGGTRIFFDTSTGDYDITFGESTLRVTPTVDTKPDTPVQVGSPEIALTGFTGAAAGEPFSGSKSVDVKSDDGVPLHAEINWTFTPDQG